MATNVERPTPDHDKREDWHEVDREREDRRHDADAARTLGAGLLPGVLRRVCPEPTRFPASPQPGLKKERTVGTGSHFSCRPTIMVAARCWSTHEHPTSHPH